MYPDPPTAKGGAGTSARSKESVSATRRTSPTSSAGDDDEDTEQESTKLETILDEEEPEETAQERSTPMPHRSLSMTTTNVQQMTMRQPSETPSAEGTKSSSPSGSTATPSSMGTIQFPSAEFPFHLGTNPDWSHLPHQFQICLSYFVENITHYHYCLPGDADNFFKTTLPSMAIQHEPLLNAVVGFSAYHMTLQNPQGKLQDFLQYYNRSVTLLLEFLQRRERHNVATLLTILQLATIEVSLPLVSGTMEDSLTPCIGVSRRLGQSYGAPESGV